MLDPCVATETAVCGHLGAVEPIVRPRTRGCEECLRTGSGWVHLRRCLSCGHVGCCDSSPGRHATEHFRIADHPLVRSFEPGEEWWWCYIDEQTFEVAGGPFAGLHR